MLAKINTLCSCKHKPTRELSCLFTQQAEKDNNTNEYKYRRDKTFKMMRYSNTIPKPRNFRRGIDNSETPFIPSLRGSIKPNSVTPLADSVSRHPYHVELNRFEYPSSVIQYSEPIHPGPLDSHAYEFITTEDRIDVLVQTLNEATEIAIDLEHHDYRSYLGFTCLIQISITGHDYIIDPLCVGHCLYKLLDPFTNPQIIKVFHGANFDLLTLQRDFGLYLVGIFDTNHSSNALRLPKGSLAFLLNRYCNVEVTKKYQRADWRVRPLPPQMERYAREDTHYLLYIYHRMRIELIRRSTKDVNLLAQVLENGRRDCLRIYSKVRKQKSIGENVSSLGREVANQLFVWRDKIARMNDESVEYVLPFFIVAEVSRNIPSDLDGILGYFDPIPSMVDNYVGDLVLILERVKRDHYYLRHYRSANRNRFLILHISWKFLNNQSTWTSYCQFC